MVGCNIDIGKAGTEVGMGLIPPNCFDEACENWRHPDCIYPPNASLSISLSFIIVISSGFSGSQSHMTTRRARPLDSLYVPTSSKLYLLAFAQSSLTMNLGQAQPVHDIFHEQHILFLLPPFLKKCNSRSRKPPVYLWYCHGPSLVSGIFQNHGLTHCVLTD